MRKLKFRSSDSDDIFSKLHSCLNGDLKEFYGERFFTFNTNIGKGTVRTVAFNRGVSLLDFDITLTEDVHIEFDTSDVSPIDFIFVSKGFLKYTDNDDGEYLDFEKFQNVIIRPKYNSQRAFILPKNERLKVNFIRVTHDRVAVSCNNSADHLNNFLTPLFNDSHKDAYRHVGSFSLRIADEIKQLSSIHDIGMFRALSLEGRLYLILSLQLLERTNFENKMNITEAITKQEIAKINKLTEYILEHISENITINVLSSESGLSPKKLQLGFKILYSKTVNEYIRQLKLEISRDYLKNTDLSVSEIVYAIGIKSRSYFSKIFFEAYEILPTAYRKLLKN